MKIENFFSQPSSNQKSALNDWRQWEVFIELLMIRSPMITLRKTLCNDRLLSFSYLTSMHDIVISQNSNNCKTKFESQQKKLEQKPNSRRNFITVTELP